MQNKFDLEGEWIAYDIEVDDVPPFTPLPITPGSLAAPICRRGAARNNMPPKMKAPHP